MIHAVSCRYTDTESNTKGEGMNVANLLLPNKSIDLHNNNCI